MYSDLIVPLMVDDEVVGTFNFTSREPDRYDEEDLEAACLVSDSIALGVKQFHARQEAEAIREISEAVQGSLDLDEILKMVLTHIEAQGYDRVRLYLYDETDKALIGAIQVGSTPIKGLGNVRLPLAGDPFSRQTFGEKRAQIDGGSFPTPDLEEVREWALDDQERSEWGELPLIFVEEGQDQIVGKISLDNAVSRRPLLQERLDRLMVYSFQAAIAIWKAQLYTKTVDQAGQLESIVRDRTAALVETHRALEEKNRLLGAFHQIGQTILFSLDLDEVLDTLALQVIETGIFRSLMVALVNEQDRYVEVMRSFVHKEAGEGIPFKGGVLISDTHLNGVRYGLDEDNITPQVARTGKMAVIETWQDERLDRRMDRDPQLWEDKVAYFIPVLHGDQTVAVLATGSLRSEKAKMLRHIEMMNPLLDQVAVALTHARLYREAQETSAALRIGEERYQLATQAAKVGVWDWNIETGEFYLDPNIKAILGYADEEIPNDREEWVQYVHPEDTQAVMDAATAHLEGQTPEYVFEHRMLHKDGSARWILVRGRAIRDAEGRAIRMVGTDTDITERKEMEKDLVHLERLRALGEMSAGVSHNLNNILTTILGPAQLLQRITDDEALLREVEDIIASTQRAADLVKRLNQAVQSDEDEVLQSVPVNTVIEEAVRAARPRWKDESEAGGIFIDVVTELGEVPAVGTTWNGLHDILVNLLFNAIDAMPEGGTIRIASEAVEDGVRLVVRDTGVGMDEETSRRVFEPFFTTKAAVGTGLGLYTVYGTLTRWGGRIEVGSVPGEGTTFTVHLPVWTGSGVEAEADVAVRPVRSGRILVVEDEAPVSSLLLRLLSGHHQVEAVESGQEALARFEPDRYDAVLIDLGMPEMAGDEVAREIQKMDSRVSTVLITGWDVEEGDSRVSVFDFRLAKPFRDIDRVQDVVAQAIQLRDARMNEQDHESF